VASLHSNRGAKRAREAREAYGLDPIAPLDCLLTTVEQRFDLPVVVARMAQDVAGACYRNDDGAVLWVNGSQVFPRQRFTLAHELAHVWCEHDSDLDVDTFRTLGGKTTNPLEIEANAFAAEFLVPKVAIEDAFDAEPCLEDVVIMAAHFGVSATMALFRLTTANVVSDDRASRIRQEIEDDEHLAVYDRLDVPLLDDRLGTIENLPYISPALAGSALAAALRGAITVVAAAEAARVAPEHLGPALEGIAAP
jgi:Zn-dependent peptidase ImmA (M78 family)